MYKNYIFKLDCRAYFNSCFLDFFKYFYIFQYIQNYEHIMKPLNNIKILIKGFFLIFEENLTFYTKYIQNISGFHKMITKIKV